MQKRLAKSLIENTRNNYCCIAKSFSQTRQTLWPELLGYLNLVKKGDVILDFGCGNGRLVEFFKDRDIKYTGIDFCEEFINIARKKYSSVKTAKFIKEDILNSTLHSNMYDKIYSIAVLHHIPSASLKLQFFEEVRRLLKKNGIAIITVWNLYQRQYLLQLVKFNISKLFGKHKMDFNDVLIPWKEGQKDPVMRYVHAFSKNELKCLAVKAGLKLEKCEFLIRNGKKVNLVCVVKK